jgi:hypothetical protein
VQLQRFVAAVLAALTVTTSTAAATTLLQA